LAKRKKGHVLFLPIVISDQSPTLLTESLWQVAWFITSLALFTKTRNAMVIKPLVNSA
jgi:hypothetical protein